jgi:hypothetical protein
MSLVSLLALTACSDVVTEQQPSAPVPWRHQDLRVDHVLLLSIDGMHEVDLARYIAKHPSSALAKLARTGVRYSNAYVNALDGTPTNPTDSFPGLLALVTGGSSPTTGAWYDVSYARELYPDATCTAPGTAVVYDESLDADTDALWGATGAAPTHDPAVTRSRLATARLPWRKTPSGCSPVYPHSFLRVNTIFEVAKKAKLRTAWSDKHPAYDIVNGPSGTGVDDLFSPEINSYTPESANSTHVVNTSSVQGTENYDDTKVTAILNEIAGFDHTGHGKCVGTPAIFGMNFQAVSVAQKLIGNVNPDGSIPSDPNLINGGYRIDSVTGTPVPSPLLQGALDHTDASIGSMLAALDSNDLRDSTLVIVTAKHGQSPIDPSKLKSGLTGFKLSSAISDLVSPVATIAQLTKDDVALIWLAHQDQTNAATIALQGGQASAFIQTIYSGTSLKLTFPDPATDSRVPDIIVQPELGVIYSNSTAKDAEHGGFTLDDVNVALLVADPQLDPLTLQSPVETTQIAPSILQALGLDPNALQSVQVQKTQVLPGLF